MTSAVAKAEVFSVHRVGEHTALTVIVPDFADVFRPGQFVLARVGGPDTGLVLPRAMYVAGASARGAYAGTVSFVVTPRGPGTRWLAARTVGDPVDLRGPFGTPFPLPVAPSPAVLVGVGYGAAPVVALAQVLTGLGCPVEIVLGAPDAAGLYGELAGKRAAGRVTVTTRDGSAGVRGAVTDLLPAAVERIRAEVVYACAPAPVLAEVSAIAGRYAIRAQVALQEPAFACGTGLCGGCVVPVTGGTGGTITGSTSAGPVRACVEGPVLDGGRVRWPAFPARSDPSPNEHGDR